MVWFRVDDAVLTHPKFIDLSDAALALWLRAGVYCAKHLTDGVITPTQMQRACYGTEDAAGELVLSGLWDKTPEGYEFHDWRDYQPTREKVEQQRESWRERQSKSRRDVTRDSTRDSQGDSLSPDPTRPTVSKETEVHAQRAEHSQAIDAQFDAVWAVWPRKNDKRTAHRRWSALSAAKREMIGPLLLQHAQAHQQHTPAQFVPYLATWLNQERWNDPLPTSRGASSSQQTQNATVLSRYANSDD